MDSQEQQQQPQHQQQQPEQIKENNAVELSIEEQQLDENYRSSCAIFCSICRALSYRNRLQ